MVSPTPASANNIDRFFTKDAVAFAGAYLEYVQCVLRGIDAREVGQLVDTLLDARARGASIFLIGNGGSASTASHFANDLTIGTRSLQPAFRVVSLADNVSVMTAIANDFGYEEIFVRQLQVHGSRGDVLLAISASGNSPNLVKAFQFARANGIKTVALSAFDGGALRALADESVHVPTQLKEYGPAEDAHLVLGHLITSYLMRHLQETQNS